MKEATNKEEAIISILATTLENRKWILNECEDDIVMALFIDMKTEYYNFKDNTVWN